MAASHVQAYWPLKEYSREKKRKLPRHHPIKIHPALPNPITFSDGGKKFTIHRVVIACGPHPLA